jgi:hypothetical protein
VKRAPLRTTDGFDLDKIDKLDKLYANTDQMHREHTAWRQVCKHLAKLGVDINTQEPLACALRLWGEELTTLREGQDVEVVGRALAEHRLAYANHIVEDGEP